MITRNYCGEKKKEADRDVFFSLIDPLLSAGMGGVWLAARIMYAIGYTRADKEKGSGRNPAGSVSYLPELGLHILTGMTAYSMIMG